MPLLHITALPEELLELIILLWYRDVSRTDELSRMVTVCRSFYAAGIVYLLRAIRLRSPVHVKGLHDHLRRLPNNALSIRSLELTLKAPLPIPLSVCTDMQTQKWVSHAVQILQQVTLLEKLNISDIDMLLAAHSDFGHAFIGLNCLQNLSIKFGTQPEDIDQKLTHPTELACTLLSSLQANLTDLSVSLTTMPPIFLWELFLPFVLTLEHLFLYCPDKAANILYNPAQHVWPRAHTVHLIGFHTSATMLHTTFPGLKSLHIANECDDTSSARRIRFTNAPGRPQGTHLVSLSGTFLALYTLRLMFCRVNIMEIANDLSEKSAYLDMFPELMSTLDVGLLVVKFEWTRAYAALGTIYSGGVDPQRMLALDIHIQADNCEHPGDISRALVSITMSAMAACSHLV